MCYLVTTSKKSNLEAFHFTLPALTGYTEDPSSWPSFGWGKSFRTFSILLIYTYKHFKSMPKKLYGIILNLCFDKNKGCCHFLDKNLKIKNLSICSFPNSFLSFFYEERASLALLSALYPLSSPILSMSWRLLFRRSSFHLFLPF